MNHHEAIEAGAEAAYLCALETASAHADPAALQGVLDIVGRTWAEVAEPRREHYRIVACRVLAAYDKARES